MIRGFKSYTCRQTKDTGNGVLFIWCIGQAAKTLPFHGSNTGSTPVCTTIRHFGIS